MVLGAVLEFFARIIVEIIAQGLFGWLFHGTGRRLIAVATQHRFDIPSITRPRRKPRALADFIAYTIGGLFWFAMLIAIILLLRRA